MENITLSREIKKENYSKFDIKVDSLYFDKETGHKVSNLDFTAIGKNIKIGFKGDSLIIYRDNNRSTIAVFDGNKDSFIYPPYLVELDSVYYDKICKDSIFKFKYSFLYRYIKGKEGYTLKKIVLSKKRGFLKVIYQDNKSGELWVAKNFNTKINDVNIKTNWERKQELKYSVVNCNNLSYVECKSKNEAKIKKYVEEKLKNKKALEPKPTRIFIKFKINCKNVISDVNILSSQNIDRELIKNILKNYFDQNSNIKTNCESEVFSFVILHLIDIPIK